jgi:phage-related protein (TIGR01555 family)
MSDELKRPTVDAKKIFENEIKPKSKEAVAKVVDGKLVSNTADGFENFMSRLGMRADNTLSHGVYDFNLLTRNRIQLEAAYRGSWVVGAVIDSIAEDMTRAGIEITTNDSDKDLKDLTKAMSRLQIWQSLCSLSKWGRLYGGAVGVIQIKGQKLDTPLDIETVAKDQFQGIIVFDRWQLNPDLAQVIDSGPEMGLPKFYYIVNNPSQVGMESLNTTGQTRVHYSRCIRYTGIDLPFFQAITEMMWGESILERLWDRLISFDNATMSSAQLIDRASLRTIGVDKLREIIGMGGEAMAGLVAMFDMMRQLQVNEGVTLMDKDDTFTSTSYTFAGLSDMMLQFGQQLAGASNIPLVRLFGQAPAGLSATGEADLRMYYDGINAQQESKFRNPIEVLLKVMWASVYGEQPPADLEFTFTPLWQMSAIDKATISKSNTETITGAEGAGLISKVVAMKELRQSSGDTGLFGNISDEDIKLAEEEPPPTPGEAEPEEPKPDLKIVPPAKTGDSAYQKIKRWLSN